MKRIFDENIVYLQDGYAFNMYCLNPIDKEFMCQLNVTKTDDYDISFEVNPELLGYCNEQKILIDKSNLFYIAFSAMLGDKKKIIIKDDLGYNRFGKQFTITNENDVIELLFQYSQENSLNPYGVHIINVVYDGRSIIDQEGEDTKERLYRLCDTLFNTFSQFEEKYDGPKLQKLKK